MREYLLDNKRRIIFTSVLVALLFFLNYWIMLPIEYTDANLGMDGGDLLTAVLTGGIPHPSGYPTYLLVGKLFQFLPNGTPFFRGSMMSAFFSATAVGLVCYLVWLVLGWKGDEKSDPIIPIVVSLVLGFSPLFWSQAVIVEVYGLASFFLVCTLLWIALILREEESKNKDIGLSILSILIGFGVGNHLMLGLMAPAMVYVSIIYIRTSNLISKLIKYLAFMFLITIVVYALIPIRANTNPPINWGNPKNFKGFFWLVSGKPYQGLAFGLPQSDIMDRVQFTAKLLLDQFGLVGLILGAFGISNILGSDQPIKWVYVWILFAFSIFSIGYLTNDSIVYLIPVFIVYSIFIGYGLMEVGEKIKIKSKYSTKIVGLFFLVTILVQLPGRWSEIDPRQDTEAGIAAQSCLNQIPKNAILFTEEDADTFPIWYYHFGLGHRPDINVIVRSLTQFDWYKNVIQYTYPNLNWDFSDEVNFIPQIIKKNSNRAVCHIEIIDHQSSFWRCSCN